MTKRLLVLIPLMVFFIAGCGDRNEADVASGPFRLVGQLQTQGWPEDVAVDDTIAVIADGQAGTAIVNISDIAMPETLAMYPVTSYNLSVVLCIVSLENGVFGSYNEQWGGPPLYEISTGHSALGGFDNSLEVYKMELVSKLDTLQLFTGDRSTSDGFTVRMIAKSGNGWSTVDGEQFQYANSFRIYGFGRGEGSIAALCFDQIGVVIYNWRTHEEIRWVDTPGGARDAVWVGNYIYVADYGNGMQVIDASTPASASIVASVVPRGSSRLENIASDGNYVFVLDANDGIYVIDVSNPLAPAEVQLISLPEPSAVVTQNGYVYVTDRYNGLLIYGM